MNRDQSRAIIKARFEPLAKAYGDNALDQLLAAYGEGHRFYHTETHIADMLVLLERYADQAVHPDLIAHAILWHDAVYQTQLPDGTYRSDRLNVEESVAAFETAAMHMAEGDKRIVSGLIMVTAKHNAAEVTDEFYPGFANDCQLFQDFDLHQFAKSWDDFMTDTYNIRQEFAWVPTPVFCTQRASILENFAKRDPIYLQVADQNAWNNQAHSNLHRTVQELRQFKL